MADRKQFLIGEQDFANIHNSNMVYIDKTRLVYDLTCQSGRYFFFCPLRPRRLGKSLLLSIMRYYFEGRQDLINGLAIDSLEKEWRKRPVIYLEGFTKYHIPYYLPIKKEQESFFVSNFVKEIRNGQPETFMNRLESLFANEKYQIIGDEEKYFHNAFYIIFKLFGFYVDVDYSTSDGRIDLLMKTKDYVYVLKFKIYEGAESAEDKQYAKPFESGVRTIYIIGINISSKSRRIDGWRVK
jgi:hypothetical protein